MSQALLHLQDTAQALAWLRAQGVTSLTVDSRQVAAGTADAMGFIAWPGAARDGRAFVAQALSAGARACLVEAEGVDLLFGYPGGAIMPFYDALPGSKLKHILVRHEQGAALAANRWRGVEVPEASLSAEAWRELVEVALCTYLAVAHFGRGRGAFVDEGAPELWRNVVRGVLAHRAEVLNSMAIAPEAPDAAQRLAALLEDAALLALKQLYPGMDLRMAQQALMAESGPVTAAS